MKRHLSFSRESSLILSALILLALFTAGSKLYTLYQLQVMHSIATDLYEHSLKVSNAALSVQSEMYKIRSDMRAILLSPESLPVLAADIAEHEKNINDGLTVIELNILGDEGLRLQQQTLHMFETGKSILHNLLALVKDGRIAEATALFNSKGKDHYAKLNTSITKLYAYPRQKADTFKEQSDTLFENLQNSLLAIIAVLLLLFGFIGWYTIYRISGYIGSNRHLSSILTLIRNVNQLIVREKDPQQLIQKSCNILASNHVYDNVWIVLYNDVNEVSFIAGAVDSDAFKQFSKHVEKRWVPHCIDRTLLSETHYSITENTPQNCLECPLLDQYEGNTAFTIALVHEEKSYGYMTLSLPGKYIRNEQETSLLKEVASDIAYALYNHRMEQQILQNEERYREMVENMQSAVVVYRPEEDGHKFIFSDLNQAAEKSESIKKEELIGRNIEEAFPRIEEFGLLDVLKRVYKSGVAERLELKEYRDERISGWRENYVYKLSSGEIVALYADRTAEKEQENAINRLKELYENVIDSVENLIFVKDPDLTYIVCNRAFERFVGRSREEIVGKSDYELFEKEVADFFRSNDLKMLATQEPKSNFEWVTYPNGERVYLLTVKAPLRNAEGSVIGLAGTSADITEQKMVEEMLQRTQLRYEKAEAMGKVGSWEYDIKTHEFWGSDESKRLYGLPENTDLFTTDTIEGCIPERERVHQALIDLLEKNVRYNLEFEIRPLDESAPRIISSVAELERDSQGTPSMVTGFIQDITERKRAEEALTRSNDKFEKAFNHTPNAIIITNITTGRIYEVNRTFERIVGYQREEVVGKTTLEIDLWNDPKERKAYVTALKQNGAVDGSAYAFKTKAGALMIAQVYASLVTMDNEEYILAVAEDITEKQEYLKQLEQKQRELETIIQEAPNPIMLHNEAGEVLMVNKVWEELSGYAYKEIDTIDKWTEKVYTAKQLPAVREVIEKLYAIERKVDLGEYTFKTKNGDFITWQFSSAPLGLVDGKRTNISSAMDITELKKKDELMMVQSRYAAMGEMIGMIAHQWRQPVSGIAMDANNMLLDIALGDFSAEAAEAYGKEILGQTEHLSKTIDDFRNYFKPEQVTVKVTLKQVLEDTYTIVRESLSSHNIAFTITYSSESEVNAYPRELMQVFVNIINNAKDALIAKSAKDARIELRVINDGEYVTTEICDNGGGIDASIIDKVFDPYFTTKDAKTGTGIGLYMSKMIIEEHLHGLLEVSNSDDGACFRVRLLKNRKDDLTEPSTSSSEQA